MKYLEAVQRIVDSCEERGKISDGWHTFDELYRFRKLYNAALFNEWADCLGRDIQGKLLFDQKLIKYDVHKSWKHFDGEECFGGGWFVVMAVLPNGQISNHYSAEDWDLFKIPEYETAKYAFDGHTSEDVIKRLENILK